MFLVAAGLVALAACRPPLPEPVKLIPPARVCAGPVVTVDEDAQVVCDVRPPQRLDVRMNPTDGWPQRCDTLGGQLVYVAGRPICRGVDY